ncbi:MAG: sporulation transcription factor Spo0A [Tenericutes bacterium]|nr:sporulation transcription factor Spo0A [Mycoplasmatota bacterium]
MIKVLVADDDNTIINMIKNFFNKNNQIKVVAIANDGLEAIKTLESNIDIDLVLLDIVMPIKDGLYVLEYMKKNNIAKKVIVISSYNEEETIRDVSEYGAKYYMLKPFDLVELEKRIIKVIHNSKYSTKIIEYKNNTLQEKISKVLHDLGIPSHIKGYQFIKAAILIVCNDNKFICEVTKSIYPSLATNFNTSIYNIERSMRHAIEISFLRGDIELINEFFGHSISAEKSKPTNFEFIVTIADKLRCEMVNII